MWRGERHFFHYFLCQFTLSWSESFCFFFMADWLDGWMMIMASSSGMPTPNISSLVFHLLPCLSLRRPTDLHTYCRRQHTSFSIYENVFLNSKKKKKRGKKLKLYVKIWTFVVIVVGVATFDAVKRNHKSFLLICARFKSKPPISTIWVGSSAVGCRHIGFGIPAKTFDVFYESFKN